MTKDNYLDILDTYCSFLNKKVKQGSLTRKTYMDYASVVEKLRTYLSSFELKEDIEYIQEIKNWNNFGKNIVITNTVKNQIVLIINVLKI